MDTSLYNTLKRSELDQYYNSFLSYGISQLDTLAQISMQDYGNLGINSIQHRKKLFQLVQTLRQHHEPSSPSPGVPDMPMMEPTTLSSFSGHKTPQQQQRRLLKNNMIGLSSVSYVKKGPSKDANNLPAIPTSMSSPRIITNCRSPFTVRRHQLPVFLRKQEQEKVEEEEEDEREIIKKNQAHNTYGVSPKQKLQQFKDESIVTASDLNQKIRVCVRKRPLSKKEIEKGEKDITPVASVRTVHVNEPKVKVDLTKYIEQHTFHFDDAFDIDNTNDHIYERTAQPLVKYIFSGGKATCFAYGQTGSGKTYTMMDPKHGLYILAAKDIFEMLQLPEHQHLSAWIGFYEIYQGQLYDLLANRKKLFAREDGKHNVVIVGLKEYLVKNVSDLMQVFEYGNQVRSTGTTNANSDSSRSHAILQVLLKPSNNKKSVIGKLSFIDLAGSERGADRGETDLKTRMEGAEINKSLLALKECIRALDQDKKHTPFRQSKLTQVLKDSFVGNSRTCMIATVSPNQANSEHTLNTLRYADRVKELKNGSQGNTSSLPISNHSTSNISFSISSSSSSSEDEPERQTEECAINDTLERELSLEDFPSTTIAQESLLGTDFDGENTSNKEPSMMNTTEQHKFNTNVIQNFLAQHRNEIRATNECSKKETKYLMNVSLNLAAEDRLKASNEFIDYLGNLDDILERKMMAIESLKDKIRSVLNEQEDALLATSQF